MRLLVATVVLLLTSCKGPAERAVDAGVQAEGWSAAQQLERTRERILLLDAALKQHEGALRDMESRGASATEVATQRKKLEALRTSLHNEERRLEMLQNAPR